MHVFIVGAGKMGTYLAADLRAKGHTVTIMERYPETAALASKELGIHVIHGDGTELATLRSSPILRADAVVAATGEDEDNLVICLLAKTEFGVKRTIARVNHPKNDWLFTRAMGVDVHLSQSNLIAKLVEEELTVGDLVTLLKLRRGDVSIVEATVAPDSKAANRQLRELTLPPDAVVVAIIRDSHVVAPGPEVTLMQGDEILSLTNVEREKELAALFRAP